MYVCECVYVCVYVCVCVCMCVCVWCVCVYVSGASSLLSRYWHSSAAYAIASEVECGGKDSLPPLGHEVYRWPPDLLKPDVSEALREHMLR